MWTQRLQLWHGAAIEEIPETVKEEDKECKTEHNIVEADVKQVVIVKEEETVDYRPYAHLNDPKPEHIKEEQEEIYVSLGGEQLNAKEEMEATSFPVTASLNDGVNDNHSPRLYPDQFKVRGTPDGSIYLKTEDTIEDEDNDIKPSVSELKHLSDFGLKTKDMDNDWKSLTLAENMNKPYSSSMFAEHFFHPFVQNNSINSDIESPSLPNEGSQRKVQPGLKFSCDDCGKLLTSKRGLNRHKKLHTGQKPYTCDVCGKIFSAKPNFNTHMKIHTGHKPYCCDLCGQSFSVKGYLTKHIKIHLQEKPFSCELCGKRFIEKSALKIHMISHSGQKPFCCDLCGQRFGLKASLTRHTKIHTGQKPFSCNLCGQSFSRKTLLNSHSRIHTGQKPFSCDLCGQRFNEKSNLTKHMMTHTGQKPFCCLHCGKKFSQKIHLETHSRVHTGQRPFPCDICGKRFTERGNLSTHMRIHTGHKPFCCDLCGTRFTVSSSLKQHMKTHRGRKKKAMNTQ
ncbi:PREDICTED: zinc finger protein OZF-like [Cyprinodon variegatus]|uniref:zinc finger protein OZF-like n=1 Tax=Cyprinodon variegatus TaxID=28743 RepID=UPI0007425A0E|nr:PREDICTED: zinc finger protein OZF-like [Cyprinodon variegatus]